MNLASVAALLAGGLSGIAFGQGGEVITVNTSADIVDFAGGQTLSDLPGPDGRVSLAEAGLASDNTPGVQTIAFAVPQNQWDYQWLFPGRVVLRPFLGFRVFDTAIIDATTQTDFTGDTNPDGGEVVIWAAMYIIDNVAGEVRGLDNSQISLSGGSGNVVQGNTASSIEVYDSHFCLIGGTGPGEGNTGGTIKIDRASHNVVVGNTVQRVRVLGWVDGGQTAVGNRIGGPTPEERNYITGYGTWGEEGAPGGTTVQIFDSADTIVEGNWIGTTPDGMEQGNLASTAGIGFEGENHDAVIRNNRIAGILGHGIHHWSGYVFGSAIALGGEGGNFTIQGNSIGLNALGEPVLGSVTGIATYDYYLGPVQGVDIGGSNPGDGNEIAGHLWNGITVVNPLSGVNISGNSIHDNETLGIDLVAADFQYGVTLNDTLDTDSGGNGLQNFPVIDSARATGATVTIAGTLNSRPARDYRIEFFANDACDPSGHGEGQHFLGSAAIHTDGAGNAAFEATLSAHTLPGQFITATATDLGIGATSEFSACALVETGCPADFNADGVVDAFDYDDFVSAYFDYVLNGLGFPDFNSDGEVDPFDYDDFVNAFFGTTGCG